MKDGLRVRFCKDMGLPIKIYESPYFEKLLELYDFQYDCIRKYADFSEMVKRLGGENSFFSYYTKVVDSVIEELKSHPSVVEFVGSALDELYDVSSVQKNMSSFPKADIYKDNNNGKSFISLDMVKANFSSLNHYSPDIFSSDTYEEYMKRYVSEQYFIDSKHIRQLIFGHIAPKRQGLYEQSLMSNVLEVLVPYFGESSIKMFSKDEIIIEVENPIKYRDIIDTIISDSKKKGIPLRSEYFTLHKIEPSIGYMKQFLDRDEVVFKAVDSSVLPSVLRKYKGQKPESVDTLFYMGSRLATYIEPIEIEFY